MKIKSLKVSGNKKVLLERISDNFSKDELVEYLNKRHYILTPLGDKVLKNSELYLLNHSVAKYPVDELQEYELQIKSKISNLQPIEILYSFAQKKTLDYINEYEFTLLRNSLWVERYCSYELEYELNFLRNNLRTIILDLSGLSNCLSDRKFVVEPYDLIFIVREMVDELKETIENYNINDETVYNILIKTIDTELGYLPFHYFSKNSLLHILSSCIYGEIPDLKKIQPDFLPPKEWSMVLKFD